MIIRILASCTLLFSVLFLPFYISAILGLIAIIYFPFFWEAVVVFFISDLLFAVKGSGIFHAVFISFFISLLLIIISELIKKKLRTDF